MTELLETSLSLWQLHSSLNRTSSPRFRLHHPDHLQLRCSLSSLAFQKVRPDLRDRRATQGSKVRRAIQEIQDLKDRQVLPEQRVRPIHFQSERFLPATRPQQPLQVQLLTRHSILCFLRVSAAQVSLSMLPVYYPRSLRTTHRPKGSRFWLRILVTCTSSSRTHPATGLRLFLSEEKTELQLVSAHPLRPLLHYSPLRILLSL